MMLPILPLQKHKTAAAQAMDGREARGTRLTDGGTRLTDGGTRLTDGGMAGRV